MHNEYASKYSVGFFPNVNMGAVNGEKRKGALEKQKDSLEIPEVLCRFDLGQKCPPRKLSISRSPACAAALLVI